MVRIDAVLVALAVASALGVVASLVLAACDPNESKGEPLPPATGESIHARSWWKIRVRR
mgnify:CR=1 FL=1